MKWGTLILGLCLSCRALMAQVNELPPTPTAHHALFEARIKAIEKPSFSFSARPSPPIPPGSAYKLQQAFFCRLEDQYLKTSKIKFAFRLGSLEYANGLEYGTENKTDNRY
jgi:hypothetical protein